MWFYAVLYKATLTKADSGHDVITSYNAIGVLAAYGMHPCGRWDRGNIVGAW